MTQRIKVLLCSVLLILGLSSAVIAGDDQEVNINEADAQTIALHLKGIGLKKAEAIVAYREQYGEFVAVEELVEVKGIGNATVERNRDRISVD